tara:strand:+ start:515 stop:820 length:306 start_codon:yes stop_codon:yes gene_type:complete
MADILEKVEMHTAYMFDCPECGAENWQRSVTTFLDKNNPEDAEAIEIMYGLEVLNSDKTSVRCNSYPNRVKCHDCETMFIAVGPGDDDDDDDDEFDSEMEL